MHADLLPSLLLSTLCLSLVACGAATPSKTEVPADAPAHQRMLGEWRVDVERTTEAYLSALPESQRNEGAKAQLHKIFAKAMEQVQLQFQPGWLTMTTGPKQGRRYRVEVQSVSGAKVRLKSTRVRDDGSLGKSNVVFVEVTGTAQLYVYGERGGKRVDELWCVRK